MGLRNRIKGGPSVRQLVSDGIKIADQVATDKDALNKLKYNLAQVQSQLMLSGKGASITKITICGSVALVVCVGAYTALRVVHFILALDYLTPESFEMIKTLMGTYRDYAFPAVAAIGLITGGLVTGTSFKRSKWSKDE